MIDTCQANTMYSKLYSPNIIATGSSAIDQSSYSHHADWDVGVAVIDRYTYYNLEFLETQVTNQSSGMTLGNLFDSYDETKIQSQAGIRYDLFPGGEGKARERLVMDFFGNVQNVEIQKAGTTNGGAASWEEDLANLKRMVEGMRTANETRETLDEIPARADKLPVKSRGVRASPGVAHIEPEKTREKQMLGAAILVGGAVVWFASGYVR